MDERSEQPTMTGAEQPARRGLQVDLRARLTGVLELAASPEHLLKLHAGAPVRGTCGLGRPFLYTRGDLDVIPAGSNITWEDEDASTSLFIRLSPALLTEAAQELGRGSERIRLEPRYQFRDSQIEHIGWRSKPSAALDFQTAGSIPIAWGWRLQCSY